MLEKVAWMNMLFDFYGQLLTDRQKDLMELYYCQNLSLGEIAGEFKITPAGCLRYIKEVRSRHSPDMRPSSGWLQSIKQRETALRMQPLYWKSAAQLTISAGYKRPER